MFLTQQYSLTFYAFNIKMRYILLHWETCIYIYYINDIKVLIQPLPIFNFF
jgi:hypothetical protein